MTVTNVNRKGEIIPDISKVVIKQSEFPIIWEVAKRVAKENAKNERFGNRKETA